MATHERIGSCAPEQNVITRASPYLIRTGATVDVIVLVGRKRLARDSVCCINQVVARSTSYSDTRNILHRNRDGLSVDAAMAVRDLDRHIVDVIAARVGRQLKVWRGDER